MGYASVSSDTFINKIWFSYFLANWVSTGLPSRRGGQGGLGAFPPCTGRGECTTGAYTAWKIFEARPAPGTRQAGPLLPAMCRPRRCCRGATTSGGDLGDFVSGRFGLQRGREGICVWSSAPGPVPATRQTYSWVGCNRGAGGGSPTPQSPLVAHQWGSNSLVWCGSGNVAGAFLAASVDLTPRNRPPEPTCAGSSCPRVSPPVPTLSLSRDLGGLSSGRAGGRDVRCNRGTGWLACVLYLWGCSWYCELQTSSVARAASCSILDSNPRPLVVTSLGLWRGCFS